MLWSEAIRIKIFIEICDAYRFTPRHPTMLRVKEFTNMSNAHEYINHR